MALTSTPKVGLIELNVTRELAAFQFCPMKERRPQSLMRQVKDFGIEAQITGQSSGWGVLLLIKLAS